MSYTAIRDSLQTLINTNLTALTGTSYKVHDRIPENIFDAQGYSITVMPNTGAFPRFDISSYDEIQTWNIDVYSPGVGTSYRYDHEDRLLGYADSLKTIFINKRTLEVNGVAGMKIKEIRFADGDYPTNADQPKYHFRIAIEITFNEMRDC